MSQLRSLKQRGIDYKGKVYPCECCKGWHIGREKLRRKRDKYAKKLS